MNPTDMLNNLGGPSIEIISISFLALLKLPIGVILLGNTLFAVLLILRVRILAETFDSAQNKLVKSITLIYLVATILGTLAALLFIIIG